MRQDDRAARVRAIYEAAEAAMLSPPTAREIGKRLGITKGYVHAIVRRLRDEGVHVRTVPTSSPHRSLVASRAPLSESVSTDALMEAAEMERANTRALERIKREWGWPPS